MDGNNAPQVGRVEIPPDNIYVLPYYTPPDDGAQQMRLFCGMLGAFILGYLVAKRIFSGGQ